MAAGALDARALAALAAEPDRTRRVLRFVALLDRALGGRLPVERPIVVGGTAIEFFTTGGYATQDVDLVLFDPSKAHAVLDGCGFARTGRFWHHPGLDLLVEFPGKALTYGPGAYDRLWEVEVGDGLSVALIGVEDAFIGRVHTGVAERRPNDLKWATEIALLHGRTMDWSAVERLAADDGPATCAAVATIRRQVAEAGAGGGA